MTHEEESYCCEAKISEDGDCLKCGEIAISCCGLIILEDGFCRECWEHCK